MAQAMNNLGVLYLKGELVPQDHDRAAELFRRAVDAFKVVAGGPVQKCPDFARAAYENLADCYRFGFGVSADIPKAQELYEAAIACGSSAAKDSLARQLNKVLGTVQMLASRATPGSLLVRRTTPLRRQHTWSLDSSCPEARYLQRRVGHLPWRPVARQHCRW